MASKKAALYPRASASDEMQTAQNHRRDLREFLEDEGYEYVNHESGRNEEKAVNRMFQAAENCEFNVHVHCCLDRLRRVGNAPYSSPSYASRSPSTTGLRITACPPLRARSASISSSLVTRPRRRR